jgi:hypothetical protein
MTDVEHWLVRSDTPDDPERGVGEYIVICTDDLRDVRKKLKSLDVVDAVITLIDYDDPPSFPLGTMIYLHCGDVHMCIVAHAVTVH